MAALVLLLSAVSSSPLLGADSPPLEVVLLGGSFQQPPVHRFLEGSQRTILYPASLGARNDTLPLTKARNGDWNKLTSAALERASLLLSTTDPKLIRDGKGVLQMAVLSADTPLLATSVLTKGFLPRFSALFGPELIVACPARNRVYVFPKLANRLDAMAGILRDDYLISPCPVSTELLEVSSKGIRAVGTFAPDERSIP